MIDWTWTRSTCSPQDILDAIGTLQPGYVHAEAILTYDWATSETYLNDAQTMIALDNETGWDAAISFAKRAVCREIDAMVVNNHLGRFLSRPYPEKQGMLHRLGLNAPEVLHDLIISPRNESEHGYERSSKAEANHAVQIARLFLQALKNEPLMHNAIISFGWEVSKSRVNWREGIPLTFDQSKPPMLLIEVSESRDHRALILRPNEAQLSECALSQFTLDATIALATELRSQFANNAGSSIGFAMPILKQLKQDFRL